MLVDRLRNRSKQEADGDTNVRHEICWVTRSLSERQKKGGCRVIKWKSRFSKEKQKAVYRSPDVHLIVKTATISSLSLRIYEIYEYSFCTSRLMGTTRLVRQCTSVWCFKFPHPWILASKLYWKSQTCQLVKIRKYTHSTSYTIEQEWKHIWEARGERKNDRGDVWLFYNVDLLHKNSRETEYN